MLIKTNSNNRSSAETCLLNLKNWSFSLKSIIIRIIMSEVMVDRQVFDICKKAVCFQQCSLVSMPTQIFQRKLVWKSMDE